MPYVPPAWNAVDFNFTDNPYRSPPGRSLIFNFGAIPGPPFLDDQLPTAKRLAIQVEDEWFPDFFRRKFAPPADQAIIVPKPMRALSYDILDDAEPWTMPRRRILVTPPYAPGRRPVLFTIT